MAVGHVTDTQIQLYLDQKLQTGKTDFDAHIESCAICQNKIAEYRQVYRVLNHDPFPELSPNFAQNILAQLNIKHSIWALYKEFLLSGLVLFIAIVGLLAVTQPWDIIKKLFQAVGAQFDVFISGISPLFGGNLFLIVGIGLILIILEVVDYKILRPRFRRFS